MQTVKITSIKKRPFKGKVYNLELNGIEPTKDDLFWIDGKTGLITHNCFQKDILNLVYISKSLGLNEVAEYWEQVIIMNDYQKQRFADNIITTLYNTVANKKITFLGWAFKKDTNDTRETSAMYVASTLIKDKAEIYVYDPKVPETQIRADLTYLYDKGYFPNSQLSEIIDMVKVCDNYQDACENSHAIAVLTEWDEFINYDWKEIYNNMIKPAFIFDGRNILNANNLRNIGFKLYQIGK